MGDRCSFEVWVKREDAEKFAEVVYGVDVVSVEKSETYKYFSDDQANFGLAFECIAAAKAGLQFFGRHSNGGGYGWYAFYTEGLELKDFETGYDFSGVVIQPMNEDGDLEMKSLLETMKHYRTWMRLFRSAEENQKWPVMT